MVINRDSRIGFTIRLFLVAMVLIIGCQENKKIEVARLDKLGANIIEQAIHTPKVILWLTEDTLFPQINSSFRILSAGVKPFCDYNLIYKNIFLLDGKEYYSPLTRNWINQSILPRERIKWSSSRYSRVKEPYINIFISDIYSDGNLQYFSAEFVKKTGGSLSVWLIFNNEHLKQVISCG